MGCMFMPSELPNIHFPISSVGPAGRRALGGRRRAPGGGGRRAAVAGRPAAGDGRRALGGDNQSTTARDQMVAG